MKNSNQLVQLEQLDQEKLHLIEMPGYKNKLYIYFDQSIIKDFEGASLAEKLAFNKIIEYPSFCRREGDQGIKGVSGNPPNCAINLNGTIINTNFKYELKIKGTNKEGRVGLCELKLNNENGVSVLVAAQYFAKGLHKAKDLNKNYSCSFFYKKPTMEKANIAKNVADELKLTPS